MDNGHHSSVSGTSRRHFSIYQSDEYYWRPSLRILEPIRHQDRPSGKKSISYHPGNEFDFLKHSSKKKVQEPASVLETSRLEAKRKVLSFEGQRVHETRSEEFVLEDRFSRKHCVNDKRNGLEVATPGDKSYLHPEAAPHFFEQEGVNFAVNFGQTRPRTVHSSVPLSISKSQQGIRFQDRMRREQQNQDKEDVKNLDQWKPSSFH